MERTFALAELTMSVSEYRKQHAQLAEQLLMLDEQRANSIKTLDMLSGAIAALDTLIASPAPEIPAIPDEEEEF